MGYYWNPIICFPHVKLDDLFTITGKKVRSVETYFRDLYHTFILFLRKKNGQSLLSILYF